MPLQVPLLLRQLLRPQRYSRRHRSTRSFNARALSPTQAVPATGPPPPAAADLSPRNTTHLQVCGSSGSTLQAVLRYPPPAPAGGRTPLVYHPPKHSLWVVGRAITPPGLSHPLGATATSTLSPGLHKIPNPPQDTPPGDNIFKRSNLSPGVCYLV